MPQDAYTQKTCGRRSHSRQNQPRLVRSHSFQGNHRNTATDEKTALGKQAGEFVQSQLEPPSSLWPVVRRLARGINVGPLKTLKFDVIPGHKVESARAGKITASEERLAGNQPWQQQQVESEIERLEGILRNPRATEEERNIAASQLQSYRETPDNPRNPGSWELSHPPRSDLCLGQ